MASGVVDKLRVAWKQEIVWKATAAFVIFGNLIAFYLLWTMLDPESGLVLRHS